ncbi:hypothetical protein Pint_12764 [Pistacia integerrima]|uniref:Uncharacterized protein n=1 Tax=Pistacia integerrima TaxID=434235 RepID=A0ACC0Y7Z0_9ROSI|nr:hypothetical protein Pint_12764 [Pistacia integerrima]
MIVDGVSPDEITMVSLVSASAKLRDLKMGEALHLYIEEKNLGIVGSLLNCLVDMYIKCGKMEEAQKLLDRCGADDVDVVLGTTLISGYVKSNKIDAASFLFDQMTERSLISWTAMISGYVQGGYFYESLKLFREMRFKDVWPDEVVLLTALSASVEVGEFRFGRSIHCSILKYGMSVDGFLGNALIDLYAKCEQVNEACRIFEQLPYKTVVTWNTMLDGFCRNGNTSKARAFFDVIPEKDVISWNTMINCYARYNQFEELFELFRKMQSSNIKADKLTLLNNGGLLYSLQHWAQWALPSTKLMTIRGRRQHGGQHVESIYARLGVLVSIDDTWTDFE